MLSNERASVVLDSDVEQFVEQKNSHLLIVHPFTIRFIERNKEIVRTEGVPVFRNLPAVREDYAIPSRSFLLLRACYDSNRDSVLVDMCQLLLCLEKALKVCVVVICFSEFCHFVFSPVI